MSVHHIGHEREPIAVIDGFHAAPEELLGAAQGLAFSPRGPHYPGIRAPASPSYLARRMDLLQQLLCDVFGLTEGAALVECNYSLVTTPPGELRPIQRLPHFDSTDPGRLAILHYLCPQEAGGTAFYRHISSGFETVSEARLEDYSRLLEQDISRHGLPEAAYVVSDTPVYTQTFAIPAAFNRLIVYRGWTLHSGLIPPDLAFSPDPRTGRLTINTFLQARHQSMPAPVSG